MDITEHIKGDGQLPNLLREAARSITLTENEFLAFCDANNGTFWSESDIEHSFHINIADSGPDGLALKWNVSLKELAYKLSTMTPVQKCAMLAALDGFFASTP